MTATDTDEERREPAASQPSDHRRGTPAGWLRGTALARAAVAVTVLPIVVATVRGLVRGWLPVGENALFEILARDEFSGHPPLMGLRSSASLVTGADVHHPGPLLFDLLAPPVWLFGPRGVAVGMAVLNVASVLLIAWGAWRRGGPLYVAVAMVATSALLWSMGSELLFDPWNPHGVLLPFLAFLVLVWCAGAGDAAALPFAAVVGSVALQTHLSYSLLVPVLGLWGVAALVVAARRAPPGGTVRRGLRKWGPVGLVVLLLCWAQPLGQQLFGDGPGNLTELLGSAGESGRSVGPRLAARMTARIVTDPPFFFRPSFREGWNPSASIVVRPGSADLPGLPLAMGGLALLAVVLVALAWVARRRRDRPVVLLVVTALIAVGAAVATAARAPLGEFGIPLHNYRWLWPVSAFVLLAVLVAVAGRVPRRLVPGAVLVAVLVAGAFSVANLPTSDQGTIAPLGSMEAVEDLSGQLGSLEGAGPLLVVMPEGFAEPYGFAVMAALQRRDIPFVVQEDWDEQVGRHRRLRPGEADAALRVFTGDAAREPRPGLDRVAFHEGLDPDEREELLRTRAALEEAARAGDLRLDETGQPLDEPALQKLLATRGLAALVDGDGLSIAPRLGDDVERYVDLQQQADAFTVAVFLDPTAPELDQPKS